MKTSIKTILMTASLVVLTGQAQALDLPEHHIYKAYENCLVTSQGSLWVKLLQNFFPEKKGLQLKEERVFFQGIDKPTFSRNHIDLKHRAVFAADEIYSSVGIDFRLEPKDGTLSLKLRRSPTASPIEVSDFKVPFFKFDQSDKEFEIYNQFGEIEEVEFGIAKNAEARTYEEGKPVALKNKKTDRTMADDDGNVFKFDRKSYLKCIYEQVNKSALSYAITEMDGHNKDRAKYIRNMKRESGYYSEFASSPKSEIDWVPVNTGNSTSK